MMVRSISMSLAVALLAASAAAMPFTGCTATADCSAFTVEPGEFLIAHGRIPNDPTTDLGFDFRFKGGLQSSSQEGFDAGLWWAGDNWSIPYFDPSDSDSFFIVIAHGEKPDVPGCTVHLDTGLALYVDMACTIPQRVGDSLPIAVDDGIGLAIPGDAAPYPVVVGAIVGTFPQRLPDGGVRLAFAPLAEVNPYELASGCTVGGDARDTSDTARRDRPPVLGHIIGYNVLRIPACPGVAGRQADFARRLADPLAKATWVGFCDLRDFKLSVAHDGGASPGANDLDTADAVELVNPDGRAYSGDDVLFFTDLPAQQRADPWRAPRADQAYWYAVQPVWRGKLEEYRAVGFTINDLIFGDHVRDFDRDGSPDAVDLDFAPAGGYEFLSPQAEPENGSLDGLGLTVNGMPLLSAPMHAPAVSPGLWPPECVFAPNPSVPSRPGRR